MTRVAILAMKAMAVNYVRKMVIRLSHAAGGTKLQIANTKEPADEQQPGHKIAVARPPMPTQASFIYKVTKEGFGYGYIQ